MCEPAPAFPTTVAAEPAQSFARQHFAAAELGHQKRNACLLRVAEKICRHPGGTLPTKLADPNDYPVTSGVSPRRTACDA